LIEEPESPWFKVLKRRFKKIVACSRCTGFIKILLKYVAMTSKIPKKHKIFGRRMNSLRNSIGKTQKSQEDVYYDSSEEFLSCHDAPLPSPPSPSMDLQDSTKGKIVQRRRRFHRTL
jgi:hypothetical protein